MPTSGRVVRYAAVALLLTLAVEVQAEEEFACYEGGEKEKGPQKCVNVASDDRYCAEFYLINRGVVYSTGCEQAKRAADGDEYHIDYWWNNASSPPYRSPCARKEGKKKASWCQKTLVREVVEEELVEWMPAFICCCHDTSCDEGGLDSKEKWRNENSVPYVNEGLAIFWSALVTLFYGWLLISCCHCFWGQKEGGVCADADLRAIKGEPWRNLQDVKTTKEERDQAVKATIIEQQKVGVREAEIAEQAEQKQANLDNRLKKLMGRLLAIEAAQPAKDERQIEEENREKYKRKLEERRRMELEEKRQKAEELKRKYLEAKRLLREGVSGGAISQKLSLSADTVSQLSITVQPAGMGKAKQPNAAEGWEAGRTAGAMEVTQDSGEHTDGVQTASQQSQTANSSRSSPMPNVEHTVDESASATDAAPAEPSSSVASATHYYAGDETEPAK